MQDFFKLSPSWHASLSFKGESIGLSTLVPVLSFSADSNNHSFVRKSYFVTLEDDIEQGGLARTVDSRAVAFS